ncbi:MAG: peptidylprolyl isomerase, partial [Saprospiraceae bacterium]|nr:peptidylprolyl isomerase [Saprospiraceae bacterium]
LPDGFYEVESALYNLRVGDISRPVRSTSGYHILRVDDIRPARREMEIAQILIKKPAEKALLDQITSEIKSGADFRMLVQKYSADENTKSKDGYIGFIGINQFEKEFEDAIFNLAKDGDISHPIESRIGYHFIRRISHKEELPYSQAKEKIKALIESDGRYQYAKSKVIDRIKTTNNFTVFQNNLEKFIAALPVDFTSFSWEVAPTLPDIEIFSLGKQLYKSKDFAHYLKSNTEERLIYPNGTPPAQVIPGLFKSYVNEKVIEFEQKHLAEMYPEFKNLMREYEEGILLFEITRQSVWDKASSDTTGLKKYYDKNKANYKWNERALINEYTVKSIDENIVKSIYDFSGKNPIEKTIKKFNKKQKLISYQKEYLEKESDEMKNLSWKAGFLTPFSINKDLGAATWKKIEMIQAPSTKSLEEARGYVIADYQDHLEKEWIAELEKEFKVEIDEGVLNKLVRK